jgi:hypothetical protein
VRKVSRSPAANSTLPTLCSDVVLERSRETCRCLVIALQLWSRHSYLAAALLIHGLSMSTTPDRPRPVSRSSPKKIVDKLWQEASGINPDDGEASQRIDRPTRHGPLLTSTPAARNRQEGEALVSEGDSMLAHDSLIPFPSIQLAPQF